MPNTTNFNWATPADTDLVKDGALAIRTLGSSIDTSLVDLKGGTTGQVLSKASNTDLDYSWVTTDDANAIQNAIVDAKGDLIAASANDTPARLAVGNNGETLVANSAAATGLSYKEDYAAGKNKIINGDFTINQRAFTSVTTGAYTFDRWQYIPSGGTGTVTPQTFTLGTAPVAGYESKNFLRLSVTTGNDFIAIRQLIESVRTFANQTITVSFWAKGTNPSTEGGLYVVAGQTFGTGGSPSSTVNTISSKFTITASWVRYSVTIAIPSIAGKTLGTNNDDYLGIAIGQGASISTDAWELDLWGVQVEAGSVATAFQTATGTIQGELAACQRYFYNATPGTGQYRNLGNGFYSSSTGINGTVRYPVEMRTTPTLSAVTGSSYFTAWDGTTDDLFDSVAITTGTSAASASLSWSGNVSGTQYRPCVINTNNAAAVIAFSAEL